MNLVGGKFIRSLAKVRDNEGKLVMRSGQLAYIIEHGFVEQVEGVITNSREWGYYRLTDKGAQALVGDFHQPNKGQDYARLRRRVANQRRELKRLHRERRVRVAGGGERVTGEAVFGGRRFGGMSNDFIKQCKEFYDAESRGAFAIYDDRMNFVVGIDLASGPDRSFLTTMGQDGVESVEIVDGVVPDVGQVGQVGPVYPSECACSCEPVALPPITREEILGGWQWRNDRGEWQAESIAAWIREFFETGKPTLKMPDMESTHALEYWLNLAAKEAVAAALEIDPFPAEDAFSGHVRQGFKAAQSMEPWSKCLTLVIASMLRASVVLRRGETRR